MEDATVRVPVTSAWSSKINWTQAVGGFAMLMTLISGGKMNITPDQQVDVVVSIGVVCNVVTWIFKTWFTADVHAASLPSK